MKVAKKTGKKVTKDAKKTGKKVAKDAKKTGKKLAAATAAGKKLGGTKQPKAAPKTKKPKAAPKKKTGGDLKRLKNKAQILKKAHDTLMKKKLVQLQEDWWWK